MNIQKQTDYCVRNLYMGRLVSSLLACFALVLFLVPAYANVGATSLTWEEYAKEVRMLEESIGFYEDWPIAQKEKLIRALVDMGHIRESSATAQFLEASMSEENPTRPCRPDHAAVFGRRQQSFRKQGWCASYPLGKLDERDFGQAQHVDAEGAGMVSAGDEYVRSRGSGHTRPSQ